jgi:hypothetical protein
MLEVKPVQFSGTKRGKIWDKNQWAWSKQRIKISDLYRGINEFKKDLQPTTNLIKDENGDLLADSHSILNELKNYFRRLLNVHGVNDVWQTEEHTAEPLVPEPSPLEVEISIEKLSGKI